MYEADIDEVAAALGCIFDLLSVLENEQNAVFRQENDVFLNDKAKFLISCASVYLERAFDALEGEACSNTIGIDN